MRSARFLHHRKANFCWKKKKKFLANTVITSCRLHTPSALITVPAIQVIPTSLTTCPPTTRSPTRSPTRRGNAPSETTSQRPPSVKCRLEAEQHRLHPPPLQVDHRLLLPNKSRNRTQTHRLWRQ